AMAAMIGVETRTSATPVAILTAGTGAQAMAARAAILTAATAPQVEKLQAEAHRGLAAAIPVMPQRLPAVALQRPRPRPAHMWEHRQAGPGLGRVRPCGVAASEDIAGAADTAGTGRRGRSPLLHGQAAGWW
ncbi:MAG: hypothetical protein ACHQZQ_09205, partial [SAR324 cluster bacterium]